MHQYCKVDASTGHESALKRPSTNSMNLTSPILVHFKCFVYINCLFLLYFFHFSSHSDPYNGDHFFVSNTFDNMVPTM